jgi:hypothetical protein
MKGRSSFTQSEINSLRSLINRKETASREYQKHLRQQMRDIGFYISDFQKDPSGFTESDFDDLIASGAITVVGGDQCGLLVERMPGHEDRPTPPPGNAHRRDATGRRTLLTVGWADRTIENPTFEEVEAALCAVPGGISSFVVLDLADDRYIQVRGGLFEGYTLEYRDGTPRKHYDANVKGIGRYELVTAFRSYWGGTEEFRSMFPWRRIRV